MANQEPKKSKYFKDPQSDRPASKYIRQEGEIRKSKYIKTDDDRKAEENKRSRQRGINGKYHKNAGQTNLQNRSHRSGEHSEGHASKGKLPQEVHSLEEVYERKGSQDAIFTNEEADRSAYIHYKEAETTPDDNRRASQIVVTASIIIVMQIIAIAINSLNLKFSFFPSFLSMEFSAIPEFIVAIAYGPVFGMAISLIKNVFHMILHQPSYISEMQNFILDTVYVFIGGWIYTRRMFNFKATQKTDSRWNARRTRRILFAGSVGTAATTMACYFATRYVSYPLLFSRFADYGYNEKAFMYAYQESLDKINAHLPSFLSGRVTTIDSIPHAIMLYNVPMTIIKFLFITVAVAILYPPITDFLHYRVKSSDQKRHAQKRRK